jgi:Co/Zn/Cd efflux system component
LLPRRWCSRNDAIGNVTVMATALAVWATRSSLPDLLVAGIMAGVFLTSAAQILRQAIVEYTAGGDASALVEIGSRRI